MNNDFFDYYIHIEDFSRLLLWLMLICLIGLGITGWPMTIMSQFFITDKGDKKGIKFSIMDFELPFSFNKFQNIIDHISERIKDTVRMNLKLDYLFMPFAYLFLFLGGWYIMHRHNLFSLHPDNGKLLYLPFIAWLMDIVENILASNCLENLTRGKARSLLVASIIKWLLIFGYIIILLIVDWMATHP